MKLDDQVDSIAGDLESPKDLVPIDLSLRDLGDEAVFISFVNTR